MHVNPIIYPLIALALSAYIAGQWVVERLTTTAMRGVAFLIAMLAAVPGVLFALYYFHWFDQAQWFYTFRTLPNTELTAAGMGLLAGMVPMLAHKRRLLFLTLEVITFVLLLVALSVPYLKMLLGPIDYSVFVSRGYKGVCLQSTASSCGPASAASLVWKSGFVITERELAQESYTTAGGTECWYLARALKNRGFTVGYTFLPPEPSELVLHSIAGVRLGGPNGQGHFVAILDETAEDYVIGDPSAGKVRVRKDDLSSAENYYFTGFFMTVTHGK